MEMRHVQQPRTRQRAQATYVMAASDEENPFEREWRGRVDARLGTVETDVGTIKTLVAAQPNRRDLDEALRSRVDIGTYAASHQALLDRVSRLESGPQRLIAWISLMVSAGMGCLMLLLSGASVLIALGGLIFALTHGR